MWWVLRRVKVRCWRLVMVSVGVVDGVDEGGGGGGVSWLGPRLWAVKLKPWRWLVAVGEGWADTSWESSSSEKTKPWARSVLTTAWRSLIGTRMKSESDRHVSNEYSSRAVS
jgi:hypothetical protein